MKYRLEVRYSQDDAKKKTFTIEVEGRKIWDEELEMEGLMWRSVGVKCTHTMPTFIQTLLFDPETAIDLIVCVEWNEVLEGDEGDISEALRKFRSKDAQYLIPTRRKQVTKYLKGEE